MWLAGFAMLVLAMGYLLLVVVSGKFRTKRRKDPGGAAKLDGIRRRKG
ncbi:MAG TPA: hypothetical protein VFG87_04265 [Amycolatopsis sp.]|jgi:hypothetical protein|nr:hypothetical protein [Amycolatopsis sp.]